MKSNFHKCLFDHLSSILAAYRDSRTDGNLLLKDSIQSDNSLSAQELESFSRIFYGAGVYIFCKKDDLSNFYVTFFNEHIKDGTDPVSPCYWGDIQNYDQKSVDLIPLLFMLILNKNKTWDTYSPKERKQISTWVYKINQVDLVPNNWYFFGLLANYILDYLNGNNGSNKDSYWPLIEASYVGDGWYSDGPKGQKDYYVSFAFHFYSLFLLYFFPEDPRAVQIKQRALLFAADFIYFFSPDGSAIPYGRSLIYRFASSAFWSMLALNRIYPFEPSVLSGLIYRNIEWWMSKDIFHRDGTFNLGYCYPNQYLTENYNSEGSPYWALKTFLVLLIPEKDDFWEKGIDRLPDLPDFHFSQSGSFLVSRKKDDLCFYPIGLQFQENVTHAFEKYQLFAYGSLTAFNVSKDSNDLRNLSPNSSLVFFYKNFPPLRRKILVYSRSDGAVIEQMWSPFNDIIVKSILVPLSGSTHVRVHLAVCRVACSALDFGFPLPEPVIIEGRRYRSGKHFEEVFSPSSADFVGINNDANNTNILFPHTRTPFLRHSLKKGKNCLIDCFCFDDEETPVIHKKRSKVFISYQGKDIVLPLSYPSFVLFSEKKSALAIQNKFLSIRLRTVLCHDQRKS